MTETLDTIGLIAFWGFILAGLGVIFGEMIAAALGRESGMERPEYADAREVCRIYDRAELRLPPVDEEYFFRLPPYLPVMDEDITGPIGPEATTPIAVGELFETSTTWISNGDKTSRQVTS